MITFTYDNAYAYIRLIIISQTILRMNIKKIMHTPIFYGWIIIFILIHILSIGAGLGFYAQSVYLNALVNEHNFAVSQIALGNTIFLLSSAVAGLLTAEAVQRIDIRWVFAAGATGMALSLYFLSHVETLPFIYAAYVCLGVSFSCISLIPSTALITRWFIKRRGLAMSFAHSGLSLGGIIITPLLAHYVSETGMNALRSIFLLGLCCSIIPICFFIRSSPHKLGLSPDGIEAQNEQEQNLDGISVKAAIRSHFFILVTLAFLCAMLVQVGILGHLYHWAHTRANASTAAYAISFLAMFSFLGRLLLGIFIDRLSLYKTVLALFVLQGIAVLCLAHAYGTIYVLCATAFFGLTVGTMLMSQPLLIASAFGLRDFPRILSINQLCSSLGMAFGPSLVGILYDYGGYNFSLLCTGLFSLLSLILLLGAGSRNSVYLTS